MRRLEPNVLKKDRKEQLCALSEDHALWETEGPHCPKLNSYRALQDAGWLDLGISFPGTKVSAGQRRSPFHDQQAYLVKRGQ